LPVAKRCEKVDVSGPRTGSANGGGRVVYGGLAAAEGTGAATVGGGRGMLEVEVEVEERRAWLGQEIKLGRDGCGGGPGTPGAVRGRPWRI